LKTRGVEGLEKMLLVPNW